MQWSLKEYQTSVDGILSKLKDQAYKSTRVGRSEPSSYHFGPFCDARHRGRGNRQRPTVWNAIVTPELCRNSFDCKGRGFLRCVSKREAILPNGRAKLLSGNSVRFGSMCDYSFHCHCTVKFASNNADGQTEAKRALGMI